MKKLTDFKTPIFLDYASTTPIDPLVLKSMHPILENYYANTMSIHTLGQESKDMLERAREGFAKLLKVNSGEIVFTSCASESNNLVIKGIAYAYKNQGKHIIVSSIEHPCILQSAKWLESKGYKVDYLSVDENGIINLEELKNLINDETILVSIMHVNNEIGAIEPIEKVGEIIKKVKEDRVNRKVQAPLLFHSDASQSFGRINLNVNKIGCDLLTLSSHKIYGPKGAGLVYIKKGLKIAPLIHGGGQEFGFRSGTINTPAIFGFWKAAEIAIKKQKQDFDRALKLKTKIIKTLQSKIKNFRLNGDINSQVPQIMSLRFDFIEGESLVYLLDMNNICVSSASACASLSLSPSHVLMAMGLKHEQAHGTIRISIGRFTKKEEIDYFLKVMPDIIEKLRNISPFK
jgi:cysteine desulfurase